jgi:hypothetical protein
MRYNVRYYHKISPSDKDVMGPVEIPDSALLDRKTLGAALRNAGILSVGEFVRDFRGEGTKIVIFPGPLGTGAKRCIWHSVVLTPA